MFSYEAKQKGAVKFFLQRTKDGILKVSARKKNGRVVYSERFEDYNDAVVAYSFLTGRMVTRQQLAGISQ